MSKLRRENDWSHQPQKAGVPTRITSVCLDQNKPSTSDYCFCRYHDSGSQFKSLVTPRWLVHSSCTELCHAKHCHCSNCRTFSTEIKRNKTIAAKATYGTVSHMHSHIPVHHDKALNWECHTIVNLVVNDCVLVKHLADLPTAVIRSYLHDAGWCSVFAPLHLWLSLACPHEVITNSADAHDAYTFYN